jgi:hypothetical protein
MRAMATKSLEFVLAVIWTITANVIIQSGNFKLFREIFNYLQKQHRNAYNIVPMNGVYAFATPRQEYVWKALCVTYVRYVCMKFPSVREYLSKN